MREAQTHVVSDLCGLMSTFPFIPLPSDELIIVSCALGLVLVHYSLLLGIHLPKSKLRVTAVLAMAAASFIAFMLGFTTIDFKIVVCACRCRA